MLQAPTNTASLACSPDAESLLPEVYALLADVTALPDVDRDYRRVLRKVLEAAQASEQAGHPLTLLPLLTCQTAGGDPRSALPVAAAWRALHIAAKLLDDVEDGDVARISAVPTDPPRVINLATGFIMAANLALARLATTGDEHLWYTLHPDFSHTVLRMAGGQHTDLGPHTVFDLETYFRITAAKSGAFFALAACAGARCATEEPNLLARYDRFGYNVGILIQLADDLHGFRRSGKGGDLAAGRRTLPVLYALAVASPPKQAQLEELLAHASIDPEAEAQARQLILALGGEIYLQAEMARYRRRAWAALGPERDVGPTPGALHGWLSGLIGEGGIACAGTANHGHR